MTFPKLWNGPDAAGEAKIRQLQQLDAPYLTASGPGFVASKKGAFCEVTRNPPVEDKSPDQVFIAGATTDEEVGDPMVCGAHFPALDFHRTTAVPNEGVLIGKGVWGCLDVTNTNGGYELSWLNSHEQWEEDAYPTTRKRLSVKLGLRKLAEKSGWSAYCHKGALGATGLALGDGSYAVLYTYLHDARDPRGAPLFRPALQVFKDVGETCSGALPLPDDTSDGVHSHTVTRACCVTAPGEMLAIVGRYYTPFGVSDRKGGLFAYRVKEYGDKITVSRSLTDLEQRFKKEPETDPDADSTSDAAYFPTWNSCLEAFATTSQLVVLDAKTLLLIACYRPNGSFEHKAFLLSPDGALIGEIPSDMFNVHYQSQDYSFHAVEAVSLGGGKALIIACDGYTERFTSKVSFYLADASGIHRINPIGFPESAQYIIHFGQPKVFKAYVAEDAAGVVMLPVWSGEGYDLYRSKDNGATWEKARTIKQTYYFQRLDSSFLYSMSDYDEGDTVVSYNFGLVNYASTPNASVPLDVAWPERLGKA